MAWKATGLSLDDIVCAVLVLVPVSRLEELRLEERRQRGLDSRLTTKHGFVVVVVVCTGARKVTDVSLDDTVDVLFSFLVLVLFSVVRVVAVKSMLRKLAISLSTAC
uniref:Uncharacterized protein n=1 Tax=Pseudo-nitzschia australis TaxID=44445 RepID=A0A7S4ASD6_9STRA